MTFQLLLETISSIHNLMHLKLYFTNFENFDEFSDRFYWSLQELIGSLSSTWPYLYAFSLFGLVTSADYLLDVLQRQLALRLMTSSGVKLVQGS